MEAMNVNGDLMHGLQHVERDEQDSTRSRNLVEDGQWG